MEVDYSCRPTSYSMDEQDDINAPQTARMECGIDALVAPNHIPKINSAPPFSLPLVKAAELREKILDSSRSLDLADVKKILERHEKEQDNLRESLTSVSAELGRLWGFQKQQRDAVENAAGLSEQLSADVESLTERADVMMFKQDLMQQAMSEQAAAAAATAAASAPRNSNVSDERPSSFFSARPSNISDATSEALEVSAALGVELGNLQSRMQEQQKQQDNMMQTLQAQFQRLEAHVCSSVPELKIDTTVKEQFVSLVQKFSPRATPRPVAALQKNDASTLQRRPSVESFGTDPLTASLPINQRLLYPNLTLDQLTMSQPVHVTASPSAHNPAASPRIGGSNRLHAGGPTRRNPHTSPPHHHRVPMLSGGSIAVPEGPVRDGVPNLAQQPPALLQGQADGPRSSFGRTSRSHFGGSESARSGSK